MILKIKDFIFNMEYVEFMFYNRVEERFKIVLTSGEEIFFKMKPEEYDVIKF